jgi:hypothetical protein
MTTCTICLNTVRETRCNVPLRCGHLFHSHCIENWKQHGSNTCPVCRKILDGSNYKVQVIIHNMYNQTSNAVTVDSLHVIDALDLFFDVQNTIDLDSILSDFRVSVADFDSSIFDTE